MQARRFRGISTLVLAAGLMLGAIGAVPDHGFSGSIRDHSHSWLAQNAARHNVQAAPASKMPWKKTADSSNFSPVLLTTMAVSPDNADIVLAGTNGAGIYASSDGGATWTSSCIGLGKGTVGSIVFDPTDSSTVYAALFDQGGIYRSTDGGQTWLAINDGIELEGSWNWTGMVFLSPANNSRLYYSGTTNGLYYSSNSGVTWEARRDDDCSSSITDLAIDPEDDNHLYAALYGHPWSSCSAGVSESTDGGKTWNRLTSDQIVDPGGGDWWHLAVDPEDFSTIYGSGYYGVYKSSDGGDTWQQISDCGCSWLVTTGKKLYCAAWEQLLISSDGGQSWSSVSEDINWGDSWRKPFAIAPTNSQVIYGGSQTPVKSVDGGLTWTPLGPLNAATRMRLAPNPRKSNCLFLNETDSPFQVYRSMNRGKSWQVIASNSGFGSRLTYDLAQGILHRPDGQESLYRSKDDGKTWEAFGSGYLTHGPWQLAVAPQNRARLWLIGQCDSQLSVSKDSGKTFESVSTLPEALCQPISRSR